MAIATPLCFYVGTDVQRTVDAAWAAFEAVQRMFVGSLPNKSPNSATSGGADAAPPEERSAHEITEPNRSRPGVIRTHDQGIMRTKAVPVIESSKNGFFGVSPVKAKSLVSWDEAGFCPVTVSYVSNSVGFGRTPKLSSRSPPGLRQVVSGDKFSIRREGPACRAARARQSRLSISPEREVQMPGQQAARHPGTPPAVTPRRRAAPRPASGCSPRPRGR